MSAQAPKRVTSWTEAAGLTIRTVIEHPGDDTTIRCSAVLVFECDSWMVLNAIADDEDSAYLRVEESGGTRENSFLAYITPLEAFNAHLINRPQLELAQQKADQARLKRKLERTQRLRKELARLEGAAS